ncbi:MAG: alpha-ketoacid dehydrogenase subunit beta, partial [Steroidobacteraceae bacterium]
DLQAPIQRVTGYDTVMPLFRLEYDFIPSVARITDAVRETMAV